MSTGSVNSLGNSYYTYSKKTRSAASTGKTADSGKASSGAAAENTAGDSISLGTTESESVAYSVSSVQAAAAQTDASASAEAAAETASDSGDSVLDAKTSEKINAMLDEAEKVADMYEQSLKQMSEFSSFLKASLNTSSDANNLYKALGLDSSSTFSSAMSSLQSIINERYTSLSDSILSAAGGSAETESTADAAEAVSTTAASGTAANAASSFAAYKAAQ